MKINLEYLGINSQNLHYNLSTAKLTEIAIKRKEGKLADSGALIVSTGACTGRSPQDRFIVQRKPSEDKIWWSEINHKISLEAFDVVYKNLTNYLDDLELFVTDLYCGADVNYRMNVRFVTNKAWHSHFLQNMFIVPEQNQKDVFTPDFTVINGSTYFEKDWKELGLRTEKFILVDIERRIIIIGGTEYSGEMKKGIFSVMNYLLPLKGVMPMHCSANHSVAGDSAVFFGLSGTGKTTLSAGSDRILIGDDEHGWSSDGIFNFEGGCYAKCIKLSPKNEPEIWDAIKSGSILENVVCDDDTRKVDFNDGSVTENTRVSYPINYIKNYEPTGKGRVPNKIIFLTCDAFGILPPVSKLSPEQASYHFLSGYTAKVAGTESGVTEPEATFSPCFGAPFMLHHPSVYGNLLSQKIEKHGAKAYLVNTGWTKGGFGVGERISLKTTRQIITAILDGSIESCPTQHDAVFNIQPVTQIPSIDENVLSPELSWKNKNEYENERKRLAVLFAEHHNKL